MSDSQTVTAEQLNAARLLHWHQASPVAHITAEVEGDVPPAASDALLTQDALRGFVQRAGLVLFSPRPQMAASPAPTIVEATLGRKEDSPSLAQSAEARTMLARLVADGSVIALNLLGAPATTAENPDFVVAATAFPYIFTLRGDKLWKQPPANSGATKVSPLALNAFTLLADQGPRSASDLVTELGKGLTEAAVLRAMSELWQHLRVLPVSQADGAPAIWEVTATRFTKQMKAGANAGQPSALSALASLYLGQALLATEDEIETFLSPLAPRSRVRDTLHALSAGQQLETIVIEGKQYLHLAGELPRFGDAVLTPAAPAQRAGDAEAVELAEDGSRIRTFKPRKVGTGFIARPKPFATRARPDRERHPFDRAAGSSGTGSRPPRGDRPARDAQARPAGGGRGAPSSRGSFARPWDEERAGRPTRAPRSGDQPRDADAAAAPPRPTRPYAPRSTPEDRPGYAGRSRSVGGDRPAYSRRTDPPNSAAGIPSRSTGAGGPRFGSDRPRPSGSKFPKRSVGNSKAGDIQAESFKNAGFKAAGWKPDRRYGAGGGGASFAPRGGGKPSFASRKTPAGGSGGTSAGFDRKARPGGEGAAKRFSTFGSGPKPSFSSGRTFTGKRPGATEGNPSADRPFRRFDAPRGPKRPFAPREGAPAPRKDFTGRPSGNERRERPQPGPARSGGFGRPRTGVAQSSASESRGKAGQRSFGGPRPTRDAGSASTGASTFDKFKGGNKPWGKRPPARKAKPAEEES